MFRISFFKKSIQAIGLIATIQSLSAQTLPPPPGDGVNTPYQISTYNHLLWIKANSSINNMTPTQGKSFLQVADIDLSGVAYEPIHYFWGNYDGNGYTISNLNCSSSSSSSSGLFGVCTGGVFNNMTILNATMSNNRGEVGLLMGHGQDVTIQNCHVQGKIYGNGQWGHRIGGLVGLLLGQNTLVENCTADVDIDSKADMIGGLVGVYSSSIGSNQDTTLIKNCSWTGTITATTQGIAGLVGTTQSWGGPQNELKISNCRAVGTIQIVTTYQGTTLAPCPSYVSGLVNAQYSPIFVVIENCYSDVDIQTSNAYSQTSTTRNPILNYGSINDVKVRRSYYSTAFGQTQHSSISSVVLTYGVSPSAMLLAQTYVDWDFITIWDTDNTTLPYLRSAPQSGVASTSNIWNGTSWSKGTPSLTGSLDMQDDFIINASTGGSISAARLSIAAGKQLTIEPGYSINLIWDLSNNGSPILLNSSAINGDYAQLKFGGTYSGSGIVKQSQNLETGSHLVSSPMATGFASTRGDASKLYAFDAANGNWFAMGSQTGVVGAGFAARVDATQIPFITSADTVGVSGTPNTTNTWTISNASLATSTGSGAGWNLLGNPYTCGLDFSNVYSNNSSLIENAFYIWDAAVGGGAGGYVYYSGGGLSSPIIPPMQAFWVQAKTSQSGSITTTMSAHGTVASSPTYYKTRPDNLVLHAALLGDTLISDRMWVAQVSGTSSSFDGAYDAWKMTNGSLMPNIYSFVDAERIAINALDLNGNRIIPVGFDYVDVGAKFRIKLEQVTNGQVYQVYLEDKAIQQFHDLNQGHYLFTHQVWTQEEPRFALHVSQSNVGTLELDALLDSLVVYQDGRRLMVRWCDSDQANYRLVTLDGKEISKGAIHCGLQSLDAPKASGLYVLELEHPFGVQRQKFLVIY